MTAITEASRKEMRNFIFWLNKTKGYNPTIIGGWAVDYYNNYYGSKDIDVVFDGTRDAAHRMADEYCLANGYAPVKKDLLGIQKDFRKKIETSEGIAEIDIDTCTTRDGNYFHTNACKKLPFSLVKQEYEEAEEKIDGKTVTYLIPTIDLLLLFKAKAYLDRDYDAHQTTDSQQINYFSSKRDKDGADVIALLDQKHCKNKVDYSKLSQLITEHDITTEILGALQKIKANPAATAFYQQNRHIEEKQVQELLQKTIDLLPAAREDVDNGKNTRNSRS